MKFSGRFSGTITYSDGTTDNFMATLDDRGTVSLNIPGNNIIDSQAILEVQNHEQWLQNMLALVSSTLALNPDGTPRKTPTDATLHFSGRIGRNNNTTEDFGVQYERKVGSWTIMGSEDTYNEFPTQVIEDWIDNLVGTGNTTHTVVPDEVELPAITTVLFHEDFSEDKAATFPGAGTTEDTSTGIGQRRWHNASANDNISGNQLNYADNSNLLLSDAEDRARSQGRIHYFRVLIGPNYDFQSLWFGIATKSGDTTWFLGRFITGMYLHETNGTIRDIRRYQPSGEAASNYQLRTEGADDLMSPGDVIEMAIYERGTTGVICHYRLNETGPWIISSLENVSTVGGGANTWNQGFTAGTKGQALITADTEYNPTPLVQHSFDSVVGPSDGAGNQETGGNGIAGETFGDALEISSNKLQVAGVSGEGGVVYNCGETDTVMHVHTNAFTNAPSGVIIRYIDSNNYIKAEADVDTDTISLIEVVDGVPNTLDSQDFSLTPDFYDLESGDDVIWSVTNDPNGKIRVRFYPGSLHLTYLESDTDRFNTSTRMGVILTKAASVSATAEDLIIFERTQLLPDFAGL
jgi:hypothetical protein